MVDVYYGILNLMRKPMENTFADIVMPLLCAFVGGMMTLLGVIITNKYNSTKMREEERKRNTPFLRVVTIDNAEDNVRALVNESKSPYFDCIVHIDDFCVKNISQNLIVFVGIKIEEEIYIFDEQKTIEPLACMSVSTTESYVVRFKNEIEEMRLLIKDVLGNCYAIKLTCTSKWCGCDSPGMSCTTTVKTASLPLRIRRCQKISHNDG